MLYRNDRSVLRSEKRHYNAFSSKLHEELKVGGKYVQKEVSMSFFCKHNNYDKDGFFSI